MILLACDQSVRGFALAWARLDWEFPSNIGTARFDGGKVARGDDVGALARLRRVYGWVERYIVSLHPSSVGFESYGFSAKPDMNVVELVGAIKLHCLQHLIPIQTVQMATARKRVAGELKVPRKGDDAKALMKQRLIESGFSATLSLDETDALVILNNMLYTAGGRPLVPND